MSVMMFVCKPGIHIGSQYIHITEIWQEDIAPNGPFLNRPELIHLRAFPALGGIAQLHLLRAWKR